MACLRLNSNASVPYLGSCGSRGCAKAQGSYQRGQELQALGGELRAWSRDTLHPQPREASTGSGKPDPGGAARRAGRIAALAGLSDQRCPCSSLPATLRPVPQGGTRASGLADSQWLLAPSSPTPWTGGRPAPQRPRAVLTNLATAGHAWLLMDQVRRGEAKDGCRPVAAVPAWRAAASSDRAVTQVLA